MGSYNRTSLQNAADNSNRAPMPSASSSSQPMTDSMIVNVKDINPYFNRHGEIKATAFNDQVDKFYDKIEENKVYYIANVKINFNKNPMYQGHKYELHFENNTDVKLFQFVPLKDLAEIDKDNIVDVIGIVKRSHELVEVTSKQTQKAIHKKEIDIVDKSGYEINMSLWGNQAVNFDAADYSVIACKSVRVGEYKGKTLSVALNSILLVNPSIPEAEELKNWFQSGGSDAEFNSLTGSAEQTNIPNVKEAQKPLEEILSDRTLGRKDKPDYFTVKAIVMYIHSKGKDFFYPACPNCNKKVIEYENAWNCEKCSKSFENPIYRYMLPIRVSDNSGTVWLTCFDDVAKVVMDLPADDLRNLRLNNPLAYDKYIQNRLWECYIFKVRSQQRNYNDKITINFIAVGAGKIDLKEEAGNLIEQIGALEKMI
ncbi:522_t:CDS:10 [Entrophospora sp. SA101]|nr:522_t:CDS:10 [Entrophospora sp. SA101]